MNHYNKPYQEWSARELTYPEHYAKGDLGWILSQLDRLTDDKRQQVSEKYNEAFKKHGRHKANGKLKAFCEEFGGEVIQTQQVKNSSAVNPFEERLQKIRNSNRGGRKSILGMAGEE